MKRIKRLLVGCLALFMAVSLLPMNDITVKAAVLKNLALNQPATESSVYPDSGKTGQKAVDGIVDANSRWSTKRIGTGSPAEQYDSNPEQWMQVDLGKAYTINQVNVNWEAATATSYTIQGSLNGKTFTDVLDAGTDTAGMMEHKDLSFEAQYIRIACHTPKTAKYGYSIYELEVYSNNVVDDEISAADIIKEIEDEAPTLSDDGNSLVLPEVPEEYEVSIYGTDNVNVVTYDNKVYQPLVDMPVHVMYRVTNKDNAEDTAVSSVDAPVVVIPGSHQLNGSNTKPNVLPGLREWNGAEGNFELTKDSRIVYTDEANKAAAEILHTYLKDMVGVDLAVVSGVAKAGDIVFKTNYTSEELGAEGYYMNIDDVVTISAPVDTKNGWIYGAASITQILYQNDNTAPKGLVRDYPQYEVRAGMIDVGRMYIPLEYLKEMTIYMSFYKMNEAHIHINDYWGQSGYSAFRLESEKYPSITAKDGYYTKDDYRQYQKDMKQYGVDVITEIDAPYHADAFKDVPGVVMWKAGYLDIRTEEAFNANAKFMESLIDEYLDEGPNGEEPVIQSNNFHIGTDEYDKAYGEQMRKWTDHFAKYVNAKGYQSRAWASLGKNGFNGTTPVTNDIVMNLWAPYWADVHETYNAGYDVINTYGGWLYIVPAANAGYPDRYDTKKLYEKFEVNDFKSGRNPSGEAIMPVAHPQTKGASFALWNDMTSFRTGFSWFDIYDRIKDAVSLVSEKTWYGEDDNGQTYEQFRARIDALQNKVPNANPGRYVESESDLIAKYEFDDEAKDSSENKYDATLIKASAEDGQVHFDGEGYLSLPMQSIGYPYTVLMNVNFDELNENATLFAGKDGTFYINKLGKLSYARDQYEFTFNYTPEVGKDIALAITCDAKNATLYVNGKNMGSGKLTNQTIAGKKQQSSTFVLPVEKVFENTKGTLKNMSIYNRVLSNEEIYDELGLLRENLALKKDVTVSGLEVNDGRFTADKAVDGIVSSDSRVSFAKDKDEQWLQVDLGEVKTISEVLINFESVVGKYEILVSEDGKEYTSVYEKNEATVEGGKAEIETIEFDPIEARYVKYVQKERWHHTGNGKWYSGSIYEFEVYAPLSTVPRPSKNALVAKESTENPSASAYKEIGPNTTNKVSVEFDVVTTTESGQNDFPIGLGSTNKNYTSYTGLPIMLRLYKDDKFGAHNGSSWVQSNVTFEPNTKYHVRIVVDLENNKYNAYVTAPDEKEVCIAENYGFRGGNGNIPENIGKIFLFNINNVPAGSHWLDNITLEDVKEPVDKNELNKAIKEAEATLEATDIDNYTEASVEALESALDTAKALTDNATQEEVNEATKALTDAMNGLELKKADYTALNDILEKAEALVKENYVDFSEVTKALETAKALPEDLKITEQKQIDEVVSAIKNAMNNLELKKADYTKVDEAIAKAETKLEEGIYTEASVKAVEDAIKAVIRDLDITNQAKVDAMVKAIEEAIANLEEKPEEPTDPDKPTIPEEDNKPGEDGEGPDSGDSTNVGGLLTLLGLAGIAIAYETRKRMR